MKKYVLLEVNESEGMNGYRYVPADIENTLGSVECLWLEPSRIIDEDELKHRINMLTGGDYRENDIEILIRTVPKPVEDEYERWIDQMPPLSGVESTRHNIKTWFRNQPTRKEK